MKLYFHLQYIRNISFPHDIALNSRELFILKQLIKSDAISNVNHGSSIKIIAS